MERSRRSADESVRLGSASGISVRVRLGVHGRLPMDGEVRLRSSMQPVLDGVVESAVLGRVRVGLSTRIVPSFPPSPVEAMLVVSAEDPLFPVRLVLAILSLPV